MLRLKYFIPCFLLLTMISIEICRNIDMMRIERTGTQLVEEIGEDSAEEESETKSDKLKLKEQLTNEDFRYCATLRERDGQKIIGTHDFDYELPVTKAVFSPPELRFS